MNKNINIELEGGEETIFVMVPRPSNEEIIKTLDVERGRYYRTWRRPERAHSESMCFAAMYVHHDKVSVVIKRRTVGLNFHQDGTSTPWVSEKFTDRITFTVRPQGNGKPMLNLFRAYKEKGKKTWELRNMSAAPFNVVQTMTMLGGDTTCCHQWLIEVSKMSDRILGTKMEEELALIEMKHYEMGLEDKIGSFLMRSMYPFMRQAMEAHDRLLRVPVGLTRPLRSDDLREVTKRIFGTQRTNKALIKEVARAILEGRLVDLLNFQFMMSTMTPEHLVLAMREVKPKDHMAPDNRYRRVIHQGDQTIEGMLPGIISKQDVHEFVNMFSDKKKLALIVELVAGGMISLAVDTIRMYKLMTGENPDWEVNTTGCNTWTEIHDRFTRDYRRFLNPDKPIPTNAITEAIDGMELANGVVIKCAASTYQMVEWGDEMHHCIGTYTTNAVQQQGVYIGLYKDGELIGNADLKTPHLLDTGPKSVTKMNQMLGKFNKHLDSELVFMLANNLIELDLMPGSAQCLPNWGLDADIRYQVQDYHPENWDRLVIKGPAMRHFINLVYHDGEMEE